MHSKLSYSMKISTGFYNLFFNDPKKELSLIEYLNGSMCDEIDEVDLTKDRFECVSFVEGKYAHVAAKGSFSETIKYISNYVVHPDDQGIYDELFEIEHFFERQEKSVTPNFRFEQLRFRLKDGGYRWVELCTISGKENGLDEGHYRVYLFDIQNMKSREKGESLDDSKLINLDRNEITNLYIAKPFFKKAEEIVKMHPRTKWCLLAIDINHFRLFDEWYGRERGNLLLAEIGNVLQDLCKKYHGVAGHFGSDDFSALVPFEEEIINEIFNKTRDTIQTFEGSFGFAPSIGVALVEGKLDLADIFDRASIAANNTKGDLKNHICVYDSALQEKSENEYRVLADFMKAIKNDELIFYLQPQCRLSTKKIVGAESLTRWLKDGEIIPPGFFIPILEKYGFITDLDKVIWEKVCAWIRNWIDRGHEPVPISINVSQVDLFTIDVPDFLNSLVKKYKLLPKYIKVEITESAYAQSPDLIQDVINRLHKLGFMVLMDDFGSGYSSLNMFSTINVDAIKLDAQFLKLKNKDYKKGVRILENVVNMAKTLSIPIIVEGVETKNQIDFLEDLGCRYVQGFYFYKPIPIEKFEKIISYDSNIDPRGFIAKTNEQFRIREFLDENIYSDTMLNNIIGSVAIYSLHDNQVDIVRFNQQFYEAVNVPDFAQRLDNIQRWMPDKEKNEIISTLKEAIKNKINGSRGLFRFYKTDGTLTTFDIHFYHIGEYEDGHRFYGSAKNITQVSDLEQQMKVISAYISDTVVFLDIDDNSKSKYEYNVVVNGLAGIIGLSAKEFEDELNSGKFFKRVDPEELNKCKDLIGASISSSITYSFDFTMKKDNGEFVTISVKGDPVTDESINTDYIITFRLKKE